MKCLATFYLVSFVGAPVTSFIYTEELASDQLNTVSRPDGYQNMSMSKWKVRRIGFVKICILKAVE